MRQFDVTIAGEINLDLILYGLAEQMPLDRELLAENFKMTLGSSSAILAHNLSSMRMRVGFITRVGSDALGQIALELLSSAGTDVSRTIVAPSPVQTGVTILLHHGSTRHILTYLGTMSQMTVADLDVDFLGNSRHFHISSLFLQKALQPGLPTLCRELASKGLTISLDTNDDPDDAWDAPLDELLDLVTVFMPNENEAKRITRTEDLDQAVNRLAQRVPIVVVKCGRAGAIVQTGNDRWVIAPPQVEPVDTIGAGDSFNAGFLKGYLDRKSLAECAAMGNATAAFSTTRPGGIEAYRDLDLMHSFLSKYFPME